MAKDIKFEFKQIALSRVVGLHSGVEQLMDGEAPHNICPNNVVDDDNRICERLLFSTILVVVLINRRYYLLEHAPAFKFLKDTYGKEKVWAQVYHFDSEEAFYEQIDFANITSLALSYQDHKNKRACLRSRIEKRNLLSSKFPVKRKVCDIEKAANLTQGALRK